MSEFKLLHIDIETTPAVVYTWALHKQDISVDQIIRPTSLLCFAAKWHGSDEIIFRKSVKQEGPEFNAMVRQAHKLLCEADAVCHFNGKTFDIPRLNQEFLRLGLPPPPPLHEIDLKQVVMRKFSMVSSRLAFVGPYLKIGEKVKNDGWPLWIGCLEGDPECWRKMEVYNRQDCALLERLYKKILPWIDDHPNMNHFAVERGMHCCKCKSQNLRSDGVRRGATLVYRRWHCLDCGAWSRERFAVKQRHDERILLR